MSDALSLSLLAKLMENLEQRVESLEARIEELEMGSQDDEQPTTYLDGTKV